MRRTVSVLVALLAVVLVPITPAQAATPHQPVLFVHGYDSDAATWDTMVANFEANGYGADELFAISYNTRQGNAVTARQLYDIVDDIRARTG
jgi:triacylglycerol esterase/lipase EstA (alpha/beta hydrolase family)